MPDEYNVTHPLLFLVVFALAVFISQQALPLLPKEVLEDPMVTSAFW